MGHKTNRHADRVVVAEMSAKVLCAFNTVPRASQGDVPIVIVVNKHQIFAVSKYGQNKKYFPLWSCQNVLFTTSRLPPNS